MLGQLLDLPAVPNGILLDEAGRLLATDLKDADDFDVLSRLDAHLLTSPSPEVTEARAALDVPDAETHLLGHGDPDTQEAHARMALAAVLIERGKRDEARAELDRAWALAPRSWVIRKQRWAIAHSERFYSGPVDFEWQREVMRQEDARGGGS